MNITEQNQDCIRLIEHDYSRCEDCYNYEYCKEDSDESEDMRNSS